MGAIEAILNDPKLADEFQKMSVYGQAAFNWQTSWQLKAHKHQIEPAGDWWSIFLMLAGRGAGKTRAAAEIQIGRAHV